MQENHDIDWDNLPPQGVYRFTRSTKDKDNLIGWSNPVFDTIRGCRWFEQMGYEFCSPRDERLVMEADLVDLDDNAEAYPNRCCKESFWEILYGEKDGFYAVFSLDLDEHKEGLSRYFSITFYDVPHPEAEELKAAVRDWHHTGVLSTSRLHIDTNRIPWEESRH